jgi:signal recognition particle subunit SRP14
MLLEGDQFLSRLTLMFDKSRTKGHVQITMKRHDGKAKPVPRAASPNKNKGKSTVVKGAKVLKQANTNDPKNRSDSTSHDIGEYMCLIRAVLRQEKISCIVHARDVNKYQMAYCNLLKNNMDGLKRQKKQKTKKATQ